MTVDSEAVLSNEKKFTVFQVGRHIIRFKAPYSLEYYTKVKEWDQGYLDSKAFLTPIKKVRLADDRCEESSR